MIIIGKPSVSVCGNKARMSAPINLDGVSSPLWFEVDEKYGKYLCCERSDAYVLAVLHYAMRFGHDIVCEAPMSQSVHAGLIGQFLPAFYKANDGHCHKVRIQTEVAPDVPHIGDRSVVATGVSCGVDSMHVFAKNSGITHGCIWNGHGIANGQTDAKRADTWEALVERARRFTAEVGVELIVGNSNFDNGCIKGLMWEGMTTNGNLFCIYCLQKLWTKYILASDCAADIFKFNISLSEDPAHYEFFLLPFIATPGFRVIMDGADCKRIEKIGDLVPYAPAQKYLNTCWCLMEGHKNCSNGCPKCMRTMLGLWCYGAVESFAAVYDVDYFKQHLHEYIAEYYRGCLHNDFFAIELRPYLNKMGIPLSIKSKAAIIVIRKIVAKVLRLGKNSTRFRSGF